MLARPCLLCAQYPNQIAPYLAQIRDLGVRSYLEIGCRWGGTYILTVEYLSRFGELESAVAVDLLDSPVQNYITVTNAELERNRGLFVQGNSSSPEFQTWLDNRFFDLVFIDGDHTYAGLRADFLGALKHGRIFVFHDIANSGVPDVSRFWMELKAAAADVFNFTEYLGQYEEVTQGEFVSYLGIGVAVRKEGK